MKILHTSDWHLGQNFMGKNRKDEHGSFLKWLKKKIIEENIDILLVAGDIFDTGNPPNYALELYYNFLMEISKTGIKSVVLTAGNHDSVSSLEAPKELLKLLNIHISAAVEKNNPENNIVEVTIDDKIICYVCAVPFVKEKDVRVSVTGESFDERNLAYSKGFKKYYRDICDIALKKKGNREIPIIGMGHTFAAGCKTSDGEREIFIGNIAKITTGSFPDEFDYLALGHLHNPQSAMENGSIRYSGSPIPLSFSEVNQKKRVIVLDFKEFPDKIQSKDIEVPVFQKFARIKGNKEEVISDLNGIESGVWVEISLTDEIKDSLFLEEIKELEKEKGFEVLATKRSRAGRTLNHDKDPAVKTLDDLTPLEVFEKRIEGMEEEEKDLLKTAFEDVLLRVKHEDT